MAKAYGNIILLFGNYGRENTLTRSVDLPLWLVFIGSAFAFWAFLDHLVLPGIRLYFRRQTNAVIDEISKRLDIKISEFKLIKRRVIIDRLKYDNNVLEALKRYCREQGVAHKVAMEKVERYAKEIVPAFNAYIYFRVGSWLSKSIVRLLYRVRLGFIDESALKKVDPESSTVFIMNHRSNMDYFLLGYLASNRVALSFAVGEWARVWPIQQLIRAMGAYFVRRGSGNSLYRYVLARYVQMATEGKIVQAVYPEGRLSKDGCLGEPKIGLLDYMLRDFDPNRERDLVFIPVGVNYDRVLEDRSSLLSLDPDAKKKSRSSIIKTTLGFIFHNLWLMVRGGWYRFGYAVANFGTPISMKEYIKLHNADFRSSDKENRIDKVKLLAHDLMHEVGRLIPVLPVSLIAYVFSNDPDKTFSEREIKARVQNLIAELESRGAHVYFPRRDRDYTIDVGVRMLTLRHLVFEENNLFRAAPNELKLLRFYANSIEHHLVSEGSGKV